jgi:transposase InsO family protein
MTDSASRNTRNISRILPASPICSHRKHGEHRSQAITQGLIPTGRQHLYGARTPNESAVGRRHDICVDLVGARMILVSRTSTSMTTPLVLDAVEHAIWTRGRRGAPIWVG